MLPHLINKRRILLLLLPLLISWACSRSTGATTPGTPPEKLTIHTDVVYGSGTFNLPDAKVGLSNLSSYTATLVLSFDGRRDGQSEKWSETYSMLMQSEPPARQLTIEKSGDLTDVNPVFMAEINGTAYERIGEEACGVTLIKPGSSTGEFIEPASLLNYVIGADEAGTETVNDIASNHYTFDQRGLGQGDLAKSEGEMWVASDGGYVVKYVLAITGAEDYFGGGIEGTLSFDYELTGANQPVEISIPVACPPGLVDAPQMPDAANIVSDLGVLTYETSSSLQDAVAFYNNGLPELGWQAVGEASITDDYALMRFDKAGETMLVSVAVENGLTKVQIVLVRTPE